LVLNSEVVQNKAHSAELVRRSIVLNILATDWFSMWQTFKRLVISLPLRTVVEVGWLISDRRASLIWDDPQPVRRSRGKPASAKSIQVCPAAIDFDARHFVVPCPIDVRLRVKLEEGKPPALENADGQKSAIRGKALGQMVTIISRNEWRHPDKPILQFSTPYVFLADDPVYINQVPPYLDFTDPAWPGVPISGRFPIHIWPRHLMWAFEWHDTARELVLNPGSMSASRRTIRRAGSDLSRPS
jgi:hypothetical protein